MSPFFSDKDYVIALRRPFFKLKKGDIVLFEKEPYGKLMKRIINLEPDLIEVHGHNDNSVDSRFFGRISRSSVFAKVIYRIKRNKT